MLWSQHNCPQQYHSVIFAPIAFPCPYFGEAQKFSSKNASNSYPAKEDLQFGGPALVYVFALHCLHVYSVSQPAAEAGRGAADLLCSRCCTSGLMKPPGRREESLLRELRAPSVWRGSVRGGRDDCNTRGPWHASWEEWGALWSQPPWWWRDGGLPGDTGEWAGGCNTRGTGLKNKTRGRTYPPRTQKEPFILTWDFFCFKKLPCWSLFSEKTRCQGVPGSLLMGALSGRTFGVYQRAWLTGPLDVALPNRQTSHYG